MDDYKIIFETVTNSYINQLTTLESSIKSNITNYNRNNIFILCERIKQEIIKSISYEYCAKERALFTYTQLVSNIKNEKLKNIIYLISLNFDKKNIRTLLNLDEKIFNSYLNRIGFYLTKNNFVINNFYTKEKADIFFKDDGNLKNVYKFIRNLFLNP